MDNAVSMTPAPSLEEKINKRKVVDIGPDPARRRAMRGVLARCIRYERRSRRRTSSSS